MSDWYFHPVGGYTLVAVLVAGLLLILARLGAPRRRLTRGRRAVLAGLRLGILLLLTLALLRPTLVTTEVKKESATLALLIDSSRSMQVGDAFGGKSRWEALRSALEDAMPALRELDADLDIKIYTFDASLHPQDFSDGQLKLAGAPAGEQTAIGAALEGVLRREAGKRIVGVILLSDGAQRAYAPLDAPPQSAARRMADLGYPLYALMFGQSRGLGQARDVALRDFIVNQTVFVKNELAVTAAARIDGFVNQPIVMQLLVESAPGKMGIVGSQRVRATKDGESLPVETSFVPQVAGEYKVTLRAEPQSGELVTTNNELSTFVTVLQGGLNVLYVEGSLRVEQKFISRSLKESPDIHLDYVRLGERDPKQRIGNLLDRFKPGKYDVYVLGDVDASAFHGEELKALAGVVGKGAGLVMLGGYHTFGPGGYAETPLADLLPVQMDRFERQTFDEPVRGDRHLSGPLKMVPSQPLGTRHFIMSLDRSGGNLAAWQRLPALDGANKLGTLKPGARVLAETPDGKPLLVIQEAGGRVMAMAADSTWHWWMRGHDREHKRFWRQVILWLARKDQLEQGRVWVKLDQRRFGPNSRVELVAGANSPEGEPLRDITLEAEVAFPDGRKQPLSLNRQGAEARGAVLDTQKAGDYTITVTANQKGAQLGTARSRFLVYEQDLELDNAAADPTMLAGLSGITKPVGGQSMAPEELPALLQKIKQQPLDLEVTREAKQTPWDTWPFLLTFVGLLSVEWYLRKKWGLV